MTHRSRDIFGLPSEMGGSYKLVQSTPEEESHATGVDRTGCGPLLEGHSGPDDAARWITPEFLERP
eukprot:CAMPEP_0170310170 /NCGR_PEP_ID=MMETSP0116_2-20130129/55565_1 /TAXON_ID=400756 /ORGANISM="Durinskia baltica, Strain CSIRO CS-38" /LENGTH=65 /DNA_ID=CAMNT_0010562433 /DNA_START=97 /DNA_END=290 /DNA_ORIENTATION=-